MSKIREAFAKKDAFIPFITAGDPSLDKTIEYILELEKAGAALIELGIPFSDPIAEGPVVQAANVRALANGCTTDQVFEMVEKLRKQTNIPVVFQAYLNQVFKYGTDRFCARCQEAGVDGIIIPDMPFEEKGEVKEFAQKYGVDLISIIVPAPQERVEKIAKDATGYIYLATALGETDNRADIKELTAQIRSVTDVPIAIGLGASNHQGVQDALKYADGFIVNATIVKIIGKCGANAHVTIRDFVKNLL